jgi:Protein of unknown function (DUF2591)
VKVRTSNLVGKALDWAVWVLKFKDAGRVRDDDFLLEAFLEFSPTTNGTQALEIMQSHEIDVYCVQSAKDGAPGVWLAEITGTKFKALGSSISVAALRCYLHANGCDEVTVPEELL